ncbi:hypothetical protein C1E23_14195 [Pseudoalteromonas phenolica]|uniref:Cadherin domain-containing protein n=1 Tax=Pseudoalteromonas phenolica TaxID=161398 RepID=A0A4Q7ILM7_9GAMM|nr:cadherin domain-containing protein [Pseudoalteromonas phenolica]RZQ52409.1 hypothetical protein C1E23_14195 [Pseudoalteromonas phenolica]
MKLLSPVSLAVAIALGSASYVAFNQLDDQASTQYELKKEYLDKKYESKLFNPKRYDKPKEALDFYIEQRLPIGLSSLPVERYSQAINQIKNMPHYSFKTLEVIEQYDPALNAPDGETQQLGDWQELGPGNIGGRTRALVVHPSSPEIMYAAGVAGGVWKSDNAGDSWQPLSDMAANLAVTTISLDPNNPDVIYAGTGEGFYNGDALRGDGIFKSTDAGVTWEQINSTASNPDFHYTSKVIHSPTNESTIYASTRTGVMKSTDSGESWEKVFTPVGTAAGCLDLSVIANEGQDVLLTACGSFLEGGVHRSTDNGSTWAAVLDFPTQGRTTLAVAPSDNNIIYALAANVNDYGMEAVYKSTDMGETWTATVTRETADDFSKLLLSNTVYGVFEQCFGSQNQFFNQGWYDNIIAVDPVNPDVVWTGGIDLFRSDDGGQSFAPTSIWWFDMDNPQYAHADQHTIVFHPDYDGVNNTTMFVGNDGGVQKTSNPNGVRLNLEQVCGNTNDYPDSLVNWSTLNNGYAVTQFYHGTVKPDGSSYFGGTQDNGTLLGRDEGFNSWQEINGGDGGWTAVDANNPDIIFSENTGLSLQKSLDNGRSWARATNGITGDGFPFITRFEMAPSDSNTLWIGGNQLWRTKDQADNWVAGSPILDSSVMSIAISPSDTTAVAAGTRGGFIYVNYDADNSGNDSNWNPKQLAAGTVSSIAFDPYDNKIIYATISTFGVSHIWKTIDGGDSWIAIDNGLPDIPATSIVVDPVDNNRLIVGTDLGVFVSTNAGESWFADGSGLANTQIAELVIKDSELFAFTHGRSVYKVDMALPVARELNVNEDSESTLTRFLVDDNGVRFDSISFTTLPASAKILLDSVEVSVDDKIDSADFAKLSYKPNEEFSGTDSFTFKGLVGEIESDIEIGVKVNSINDKPIQLAEITPIEAEVGDVISLDVAPFFSDIENEKLTFTAESNRNELAISPEGVISGSFVDTFDGEFEFKVSDESGAMLNASVDVSISPSTYFDAPEIEIGQTFFTDENVAVGTVLGKLKFELPNPDKASIVRFNIYGNDTFRIDNEGNVIVQGEVDYEYTSLYTFTVQAEDSKGNLSNNPKVHVKVNDLRGNDDDDNDGDAGSLGWIALLASPLAFLRRRRK